MSSLSGAIAARYSCRTFDKSPLAARERLRVEALLAGPHDVPFGSRVRFALLDAAPGRGTGATRLGTYGIIHGAPSFIAGAVRNGPRRLCGQCPQVEGRRTLDCARERHQHAVAG